MPAAYKALIDKSGFDLRIFSGNLEKLADYVGNREKITKQDVANVLNRTKIDPIFELTNAMAEKNKEKSLFYLDSLLASGLHPLQIVAALTNQLRKMLLYRSLVHDLGVSGWYPNISFNEFKSKIIPLIQEKDQTLAEQIIQWEKILHPETDSGKKKKTAKKGKKNASSDIFLAQNPGNAYPIFQQLRKSALFEMEDLIRSMENIGKVDRMLKSSSIAPKTLLVQFLIDIC